MNNKLMISIINPYNELTKIIDDIIVALLDRDKSKQEKKNKELAESSIILILAVYYLKESIDTIEENLIDLQHISKVKNNVEIVSLLENYELIKNYELTEKGHDLLRAYLIKIGRTLDTTDLLILNEIQRYSQSGIIKITLLENINAIFSPVIMATSSFYKKLTRLQRNKILYQRGQLIHSTALTSLLINDVTQLIACHSINILDVTFEIIPKFVKTANIGKYHNLLIVKFDEAFDPRLSTLLTQFADNSFILSDDKRFSRYQARGVSNVSQTTYRDGVIREADNYFDACIVLGYDDHTNNFGYSNFHWLKEIARVSKNDAVCIIAVESPIDNVDHYFLNHMIQLFKSSYLYHYIDFEKLKNQMIDVGIASPQKFEHKGITIAYGKIANQALPEKS